MDQHHVFPVLSQCLCLNLVLTNSEAAELADCSITHHMRLLTSFSANGETFYTHSPSEPILALGSIDIFVQHRLVEKGILGELAACTLLLIACDFATPLKDNVPNLLEPVHHLDFLLTLLATTDGLVPMKQNLKQPLGGALQCCFNQEGIDLLIPTHFGSIEADVVFDPTLLSATLYQVKFKVKGDKKAESVVHPISIPHDLHQPLPYIMILMELGNESKYQDTGSKAKSTACSPIANGEFEELLS
ncbi:hypothetical protein BU17DRAFT_65140 [Hysterangium stoloniferum]|nr:hypothetical protein BU17DRAFT_65140 [Hysterangium stoloniferum]